jgi:hypothetical protein
MHLSRTKPIAFFTGVLFVFIYMLLANPLGVPADAQPVSMLGSIFSYPLPVEAVMTILLRALLIFVGGFSLVWLALALMSRAEY